MPANQNQPSKEIPRLYHYVLQAIVKLNESGGSHLRSIIDHVQLYFNEANGDPKPRNLTVQVRRAIDHGVAERMLSLRGDRIRITFGSKNANVGRTSCGFVCKKKKKAAKGVKSGKSRSRRQSRGKHGSGSSCRRSKRHRSSKGSGGGDDPCTPKKKSGRVGKRSRRSSRSGVGSKRKRNSSESGGSSGCAPKRKKKVHSVKNPKKCMQQSSEDNTDDNICTCDTCEANRGQKSSHVSFADEDEICDQHSTNRSSEHLVKSSMQKRTRSNQPPRRTSRQIRQGTPKHLDRLNHDFLPEQHNEDIPSIVPRISNPKKEDDVVRFNRNTDYINKNFNNKDFRGISEECDNPNCLCNIKQAPADIRTDHCKIKSDQHPQQFSDRKRNYRDRNRDHDTDRNGHPGPDRGNSFVPDPSPTH